MNAYRMTKNIILFALIEFNKLTHFSDVHLSYSIFSCAIFLKNLSLPPPPSYTISIMSIPSSSYDANISMN